MEKKDKHYFTIEVTKTQYKILTSNEAYMFAINYLWEKFYKFAINNMFEIQER